MEWAARNLITLSTILLAFAALCAEIVDIVPKGSGVDLSKWSIGFGAVARGVVHAARELRSPPVDIAADTRDRAQRA